MREYSLSSQSSPDNIFAQAMQNCLFPSNTYSHVSGGLPVNILDLEVQEYKMYKYQFFFFFVAHAWNERFY